MLPETVGQFVKKRLYALSLLATNSSKPIVQD
jgi:hypothetical protein